MINFFFYSKLPLITTREPKLAKHYIQFPFAGDVPFSKQNFAQMYEQQLLVHIFLRVVIQINYLNLFIAFYKKKKNMFNFQ